MSIDIQNIVIFVIFICAVWKLIRHFYTTFDDEKCPSSCGSCPKPTDINQFKITFKDIDE